METKKIVIDTEKEVTMKEYAKIKGVPYDTIKSKVRRKQIKFRIIEELNHLILVEMD